MAPHVSGDMRKSTSTTLAITTTIGLTLGLTQLWILLGNGYERAKIGNLDFVIFYRSAWNALHGERMYAAPDDPAAVRSVLLNFNPPHFHTIIVPLVAFKREYAFIIWSAMSVTAAIAAVRLAAGCAKIAWPSSHWLATAAIVIGAAAVGSTFTLGQLSWVLALVLTLAWRADRENDAFRASVWMGVAVSLKPFLLLFVPYWLVRYEWSRVVITLVVAAGLILGGGLLFGMNNLFGWIHIFCAPMAEVHSFNASLVGFMRRAWPELPFAGTVLAIVCGSASIVRLRHADADIAWAGLLIAALLCSPLGWIYYAVYLIGPMLALVARRQLPRWTWLLLPLWLWPPLSSHMGQSTWILSVTIGSVYFWGFVGLWIAVLLSAKSESMDEACVRAAP